MWTWADWRTWSHPRAAFWDTLARWLQPAECRLISRRDRTYRKIWHCGHPGPPGRADSDCVPRRLPAGGTANKDLKPRLDTLLDTQELTAFQSRCGPDPFKNRAAPQPPLCNRFFLKKSYLCTIHLTF